MSDSNVKVIGVITQAEDGRVGLWEDFALTRDENHDIMCLMGKYRISNGSTVYGSLQELYTEKAKFAGNEEIVTKPAGNEAVAVDRSDFIGEYDAITYGAQNIDGSGCYIRFSHRVRVHCYTEKMSYGADFYTADAEVFNGRRFVTIASWSDGQKDSIRSIIRHACWACEQYI